MGWLVEGWQWRDRCRLGLSYSAGCRYCALKSHLCLPGKCRFGIHPGWDFGLECGPDWWFLGEILRVKFVYLRLWDTGIITGGLTVCSANLILSFLYTFDCLRDYIRLIFVDCIQSPNILFIVILGYLILILPFKSEVTRLLAIWRLGLR